MSPPIKVFTISHLMDVSDGCYVRGLVGLGLGLSFEHVAVHMHDPPAESEEKLGP